MERMIVKRILDLYDNNIEAAIKVRKKNSSYRFMGCNPRRKVVVQQLKNLEKWKSSVSYGQRWIVESVFSSMKRMFGEYVSARRFLNMVKEMMLKALLYNTFIRK
ncbi:MAG: transposase [Candidatus Nitrosopolaris sp.]